MSSAQNLFRVESLEPRRFLSAGSLDPTFGVNGVVIESAHITPNDMVLQSDGKILISDSTQVFRFNANGSPDTSFGTDGVITPGFTVAGIALQPNGKIVVGGDANDAWNGTTWVGDWAVARYNASGTPDTTFGSGTGQVITDTAGYTGYVGAAGVVIEPDDNIVVGGVQASLTGLDATNFAAICFNADGSVNTAFGTNGEVNSNTVGMGGTTPTSMAQTPDGDILLGGYITEDANDCAAAAFSEAGAVLAIPGPSDAGQTTGVYVQSVASTGNGTAVFSTADYNQSPGTGKSAILQIGNTQTPFVFDPFSDPSQQNPGDVTNAPGDRLIVLGTTLRGLGVARFNSNATLDPTFGLAGSVTLTPSMLAFSQAPASAIAVQGTGDILIAGTQANGALFLAALQGGSNAVDQVPPAAFCDPTTIVPQNHRRYQFTVQYAANVSINAATISNTNILVTGPHGAVERAKLASLSTSSNVTTAIYTVRIDKLGVRNRKDLLSIHLQPNQVLDNFANPVAPGLLGQFQPLFP